MLVVTKGETKDKDHGRLGILKALSMVDGAHADVGLFEGEKDGLADYGELNIAEIGAVHEFGSSVVPERSWLRSNHDRHIESYHRRLDRLYGRILQGKASIIGGLTAFAEKVAGDARRSITELSEPPITERTKQQRVVKGTSNPLVDTGTMRQSVRGRVLMHGRKV